MEPGYDRFIDAIDRAEVVVVGAPTLLETAMVLSPKLGHDARPLLMPFLPGLGAEVVAFNEQHLAAATTALLRHGRGRHAAAVPWRGFQPDG